MGYHGVRPAVCRHCGKFKNVRNRGLCWSCYYGTPEVRGLYESGHPSARRGHGSADREPAEPTTALPGSAEKITVLERRAANGERLWHPLDAGLAKLPAYDRTDLMAGTEAARMCDFGVMLRLPPRIVRVYRFASARTRRASREFEQRDDLVCTLSAGD